MNSGSAEVLKIRHTDPITTIIYMQNVIISDKEAEAQDMRPLTRAYSKGQMWMLENVVNDLKRGGIQYALVQKDEGIEVWRAKSCFI
jgi:hypothetical protein